MDQSEERILMCEKAHEIQELWKPQVGDWFLYTKWGLCPDVLPQRRVLVLAYYHKSKWDKQDISWSVLTYQSTHEKEKDFKASSIWLPRQDQLQAMVIGNGRKMLGRDGVLYRFNNWLVLEFLDYDNIVTDEKWRMDCSMEQLWLCFVMYEKYNKLWDSERKTWVKES